MGDEEVPKDENQSNCELRTQNVIVTNHNSNNNNNNEDTDGNINIEGDEKVKDESTGDVQTTAVIEEEDDEDGNAEALSTE